MIRRLMNYLILIVLAYVGLCLFIRWREPRMLYYPDRQLVASPRDVGLAYEDVTLTTTDNVTVHGWFVPATAARWTILFLHGNAGNISHRLDKLKLFHDLGANVFALDYRGYGRSAGTPNEAGTYRDAAAALAYLNTRAPRPILYGESLGTAIAVETALHHPVAGVILEAPFASVADVGQKMFPFLPVRLIVRNRYDTLRKISQVNAPLLILHSRDDEMFASHHAERLFAAARDPKELVELRGGHNDFVFASADTYRAALEKFLAKLDAAPPSR